MIFTETTLPGVFAVDLERREDARGFFARSWCAEEFAAKGLSAQLVQCNISYNIKKGTLRGMHYQNTPHAEAKLVRCTKGRIFDVCVDLRRDSPAYLKWTAVELTQENRSMIYIPAGVAHGFQSLTDDAEVFYQMSEYFHSECSRGVRWNDPLFGIVWPLASPILSEKDAAYPDYQA